ncbi:carbohydrate kinase family protein, partial [Halalkalibacterium halodurans]|uniref:carbohydrate kinase family protein n=1 Tax=Halalkalibacterium halodurans TaxID=86665 RepID=UPI002E234BDF|nr:carbohydrate kinase family protein [Halalkalibacterium halodurans]
PVGAGDGFAAGVLASLLEGKSMEEAVSVGTQIGALVVMAKGDMEGLPEPEQLEAFSQARSDVLR